MVPTTMINLVSLRVMALAVCHSTVVQDDGDVRLAGMMEVNALRNAMSAIIGGFN